MLVCHDTLSHEKQRKKSIKEIKNNLLSEPVSLIYYLYQTVRISNLFQKDISLCVIMEKAGQH